MNPNLLTYLYCILSSFENINLLFEINFDLNFITNSIIYAKGVLGFWGGVGWGGEARGWHA